MIEIDPAQFIDNRLHKVGRPSTKTLEEQLIIGARDAYDEAGRVAVERAYGSSCESNRILRKKYCTLYNNAGYKAAELYLRSHSINDDKEIVKYFQKCRFGKHWKKRYKQEKIFREAVKTLPKRGRPRKKK